MTFRPLLALTLTCALSPLAFAQDAVPVNPQPAQNPASKLPDFSEELFPHGMLEQLLTGRVGKDGSVDYARLKGDEKLAAYVTMVGMVDRSKFPVVTISSATPTEAAKLDRSFETSFLINAHNALVLKALADAYPVDTIDEAKGLETEKRFVVGGKTVSLQELRDEITARDPRAFFALTTGSKGGPVVSPRPYTFTTLNKMLDDAAKAYINDPRKIEVLRIENKVTIDKHLQGADALFAPANAKGEKPERSKWAGVRHLLKVYATRGAEKRYFNSGDYKIAWRNSDRTLNYENATSPGTSTSTMTPVTN